MDIKPPSQTASTGQTQSINTTLEQAAPNTAGKIIIAVVESSSTRPATANPNIPNAAPPNSLFDVILSTQDQRIQTQSNHPFKPGQLLKIQILADTNIRVLEVIQSAQVARASDATLLQQGLREALPLQQNLSILLNSLIELNGILIQQPQNTLIKKALSQINSLINQLPKPQDLKLSSGLKQALANSGSFLENRLRQVIEQLQIAQASNTAGPKPSPSQTPLNQFIQSQRSLLEASQQARLLEATRQLSNTPVTKTDANKQQSNRTPASDRNQRASQLNEALRNHQPLSHLTKQIISQDTKAQLLSLAGTLAPLLPSPNTATSASQSAASVLITRILGAINQTTQDSRRDNANTGLSGTAQASSTTVTAAAMQPGTLQPAVVGQADAGGERLDLAMSTILRQLAASLARVQNHQFSSLASQQGTGDLTGPQSWYVELPVLHDNGQFRPIQLRIEEDQYQQHSEQESSKIRQWKITLGFDFEELGEFFATLTLTGSNIATTFWSEKPQTLTRIQQELDVLKRSLTELGLEVEQLECRRGKPPLSNTQLDQQLVDIRT